MTHTTIPSQLEERAAIQDVVDGIDAAVDAKDWTTCRSYFVDTIDVDFSALDGGAPARLPADDLITLWSTNLFAGKGTMHLRGNHQFHVDGDTATVTSNAYAINSLHREVGSDLWEVWGTYTHRLIRTATGWHCTGMGLTVTAARGNETVRTWQPPSGPDDAPAESV